MTCANTRCLHQFCWLCLHDWTSPSHDSSRCAMRLDDPDSGALGNDEVMAVVEQRILTNWDTQPMETRPSRDTYAAEVRHRFGKALSVVLDSDRDLIYNDEPPALLHLNFRLMFFYDQQERRCRRLAEAVFSKAAAAAAAVDGPKRRDGVGDLNGLLGWLRARWWLRLDPEDAAVYLSHERAPIDRRVLHEQMRATQLRAEHALHCFQSREAKTRQTELHTVAVEAFLRRFSHTMPANAWSESKQLVMELVAQSEQMHAEHASRTTIASQVAEIGIEAHRRLLLDVNRSLAAGVAACCAWRANRLLELVGALKPIRGEEAQRVALAASQWADATESRLVALRGLLGQWLGAPGDPDPVTWRYQIAHTASLLDAARRRLFELALEYCGGTRNTVRRRGQR